MTLIRYTLDPCLVLFGSLASALTNLQHLSIITNGFFTDIHLLDPWPLNRLKTFEFRSDHPDGMLGSYFHQLKSLTRLALETRRGNWERIADFIGKGGLLGLEELELILQRQREVTGRFTSFW